MSFGHRCIYGGLDWADYPQIDGLGYARSYEQSLTVIDLNGPMLKGSCSCRPVGLSARPSTTHDGTRAGPGMVNVVCCARAEIYFLDKGSFIEKLPRTLHQADIKSWYKLSASA